MVDTPAATPRAIQAVRAVGGLRYLFLSHRDEIGEIGELHPATGGAVIMHRSEADLVPCGVDLVFDTDFEVEPGVTVIHTPGHSPGSSCLLVERDDLRILFTGDHILRRRADQPAPLKFPWTWDWEAQRASARRLLELEFDYIVPSHAEQLEKGYFADARALLERSLAGLDL
jgi:glyoxylase-like metal-dependent hydrolase (beta-lactamase superfamily II)